MIHQESNDSPEVVSNLQTRHFRPWLRFIAGFVCFAFTFTQLEAGWALAPGSRFSDPAFTQAATDAYNRAAGQPRALSAAGLELPSPASVPTIALSVSSSGPIRPASFKNAQRAQAGGTLTAILQAAWAAFTSLLRPVVLVVSVILSVPALVKAQDVTPPQQEQPGKAGVKPEELKRLVEALKDQDRDVRNDAVEAFGKLGPEAKAAVPDLLEILKNSTRWEKNLRDAVAKAIVEIGSGREEAVRILAEKAEEEPEALETLVWFGHDAVPILDDAMGKDGYRRYIVARALGETDCYFTASDRVALIFPSLFLAAGDPEASIRKVAVIALGNIGRGCYGSEKFVVLRLWQALFHDSDYEVRGRAAAALEAFSDSDEAGELAGIYLVEALLTAKDSFVRQKAAWSLKYFWCNEAIKPYATRALQNALRDEDLGVRIVAARALSGWYGPKAKIPTSDLIKALDAYDVEVGTAAAKLLKMSGDKSEAAISALIRHLSYQPRRRDDMGRMEGSDERLELLFAASLVEALGEMYDGQPDVLAALMRTARYDPDRWLTGRALEALRGIGPALIEALKDPESSVRSQAAEALDLIGVSSVVEAMSDGRVPAPSAPSAPWAPGSSSLEWYHWLLIAIGASGWLILLWKPIKKGASWLGSARGGSQIGTGIVLGLALYSAGCRSYDRYHEVVTDWSTYSDEELFREWESNPDGVVRAALQRRMPRLSSNPEIVEKLIGILQSSNNSSLRSSAAGLLAIGRVEAAVPALQRALLNDKDVWVRMNAARALGEMGPNAKAAVPALAEALKDPEEVVYKHAKEALREMGPDAVSALVEALKNRDGGDRVVAVRALGVFGLSNPAAADALIEALKDPEASVRQAAAEALGVGGYILSGKSMTPWTLRGLVKQRIYDRHYAMAFRTPFSGGSGASMLRTYTSKYYADIDAANAFYRRALENETKGEDPNSAILHALVTEPNQDVAEDIRRVLNGLGIDENAERQKREPPPPSKEEGPKGPKAPAPKLIRGGLPKAGFIHRPLHRWMPTGIRAFSVLPLAVAPFDSTLALWLLGAGAALGAVWLFYRLWRARAARPPIGQNSPTPSADILAPTGDQADGLRALARERLQEQQPDPSEKDSPNPPKGSPYAVFKLLLSAKKPPTKLQIARKLHRSVRTIEPDLALLKQLNVVMAAGRGPRAIYVVPGQVKRKAAPLLNALKNLRTVRPSPAERKVLKALAEEIWFPSAAVLMARRAQKRTPRRVTFRRVPRDGRVYPGELSGDIWGDYGDIGHRFPRVIKSQNSWPIFERYLKEAGIPEQEVHSILENGIYWTDKSTGKIGKQSDKVLKAMAEALSELLGRPVSLDDLDRVIRAHEAVHQRLKKEDVVRIRDRLQATLGVADYEALLSSFQRQYGEYLDELQLIEELIAQAALEKFLGNVLRVINEKGEVVAIDPRAVPIMSEALAEAQAAPQAAAPAPEPEIEVSPDSQRFGELLGNQEIDAKKLADSQVSDALYALTRHSVEYPGLVRLALDGVDPASEAQDRFWVFDAKDLSPDQIKALPGKLGNLTVVVANASSLTDKSEVKARLLDAKTAEAVYQELSATQPVEHDNLRFILRKDRSPESLTGYRTKFFYSELEQEALVRILKSLPALVHPEERLNTIYQELFQAAKHVRHQA